MAIIKPFQAWRYDTGKVRLDDVVTQPYDKISPEMQDRYYAASPNNLVRIILGKHEPGDDAAKNVYSRAGANFREWRSSGVLQTGSRARHLRLPAAFQGARRPFRDAPHAHRLHRPG